jgi:carboxylesterase type B
VTLSGESSGGLSVLSQLVSPGARGLFARPQQQLAAAMKQYWTDLAKTGSPDSWTEPLWPRFDSASQQLLSLTPPQPQVGTGFAAAHHCPFWALAS